ncbi:unnamed protein product [Pieris brassicae]|uniref:C2H2-type domain-containing protein n=1 Tax=Pieris brassicae TaxID=7116 RepID=A0A9P0SHS4_PIEBR|nr:unnamed protein product [Pieris brassicae]
MTDVEDANIVKSIEENKSAEKCSGNINIKEEGVIVKKEDVECMLCVERCGEVIDINTRTHAGTLLHEYLAKYTQVDITAENTSKQICKNCFDLVDVLEQTEVEYLKLKVTFEGIISKNPLFDAQLSSVDVVKRENNLQAINQDSSDSEDEPLSLTKKKRIPKSVTRKIPDTHLNKKKTVKTRRKLNEESWECKECDEQGNKGGQAGLVSHMLLKHMGPLQDEIIKKENNDKSHDIELDEMLKVEDDGFGDNDDEDYIPEPEVEDKNDADRTKGRGRKKGARNKPKPKKHFYCDKCPSKFTSPVRLEQHNKRHEAEGKPPFICEVCGAHYKHKRACDIHVALHKGISDWKCEECNKLFPSKGALQRHNNIHTGKLNYQCDLCGKSFIHTSSFKMHKLSHSGVKPHACDVCGLALMTRSHLKRHKRVHSGEKRHECVLCGKRFSERYNLLAHAKSHDPHAANPSHQPATERRRMFRCPYCQERYERRYLLERHVSTSHGRSLERPPATPRNTMSKLLKAQAQRRAAAPLTDDTYNSDTKESQSPEARSSPATAHKLTQNTPADPISAWTNAYAAEFGLRQDYAQ